MWDGIIELQRICHNDAVKAGWWKKPREVGTMLCLIHSEISEAMEGDRKDLRDDKLPHSIRILDLAGWLGLDIAGAIKEKLEFNRTRQDHKLEARNAPGGKAF